MKNGCFTKHLLKNGCLGFQVIYKGELTLLIRLVFGPHLEGNGYPFFKGMMTSPMVVPKISYGNFHCGNLAMVFVAS